MLMLHDCQPVVLEVAYGVYGVSGILEQLEVWIRSIIEALGYPGISIIMFTENIFPPIPSELVMPLAGFTTVTNPERFSFVGIVVAGTIGSVLGAVVLYYIGMWANETIIRRFVRRWGRWFLLSEKDIDRALGFFDKYGPFVVFFGRLIPIVRSLISIPAGMNRMPLITFLIFTTAGAAIWTTLLAYAGVLLGENWREILDIIDRYQTITLVVIVVLVVIFIVWKLMSRNRDQDATSPAAQ